MGGAEAVGDDVTLSAVERLQLGRLPAGITSGQDPAAVRPATFIVLYVTGTAEDPARAFIGS
jgi:hypothetical protein